MINAPKTLTKRLLAVHGWSGIILGFFLYVVLLTGAVAVFAHEIGTWSVGGKAVKDPLGRWVSVALKSTAKTVPDQFLEDILIYPNAEGRLVFFFHTHATNPDGVLDDKGVLLELDPETHAVLSRQQGFGEELFGHDPAGALDEFIVDLHVNLHLPDPWGLYATGVLGFVMLSSAISGLLLHRHLVTDLFLAPRLSSRLLNARDRHNLLGSWGLPFAIIVAVTGAFLSFGQSVGFPLLTSVAFGGDQVAMYRTLYGENVQHNAAHPTAMAHLDGIISQSRKLSGQAPEYLLFHHYGLSDAEVIVSHPPQDGHFKYMSNVFDGTTGRFLGARPEFGASPSLGNDVIHLTSALHFGSFAGKLSRLIWLALGIGMAALVWTGLKLWLERRSHDAAVQRFSRFLPTVCFGLPIALAGAAVLFFLSLPLGTTRFWTPVGFVMTSAIIVLVGCMATDVTRLELWLKRLLGFLLVLLPVLRMAVTGLGWNAPSEGWIVGMLDLASLGAGAFLLSRTWPVSWIARGVLTPKIARASAKE